MSNTQNQQLLEYLLETHEEMFGTQPHKAISGKPIKDKIAILEAHISKGFPVEFDEDIKNINLNQ